MSDTQQSSPSAAPEIPIEISSAPSLGSGVVGGGELVPMPDQIDLPAKGAFASAHADYINGYIVLADTKAAWAFAIPATAIAYLSSQQEVWRLVPIAGNCWLKALGVLAFGLLVSSAAAAFAVIVPRLGGAPQGIFYFGSVAKRRSAAAFVSDLASLSEADLVSARLRHNYEIAGVCQRKYRALRIAMWSGVAGLAATFALIAVLKLAPPEQPASPRVTSARSAPVPHGSSAVKQAAHPVK